MIRRSTSLPAAGMLAAFLLSAAEAAPARVPRIKMKIGGGWGAAAGIAGGGVAPALNNISATSLNGITLPSADHPLRILRDDMPVSAAAETEAIAASEPLPKALLTEQTPVPELGGDAFQEHIGAASQDEGGGLGKALETGMTLFDGGGERDPFTVSAIAREGKRRSQGWTADGQAVRWVSGGAFKDLLELPGSDDHLIALFDQAGADDAIGSRSERDRELKQRAPLAKIGAAPKVHRAFRVSLKRPDKERVIAAFTVERVKGTTLDAADEADLELVRNLFTLLIEHRVFWGLEPQGGNTNALDPKVVKNIMVGSTASDPRRRAYIVDADSRRTPPKYGRMDRLLGRPDPLVAHYARLFREIRRQRIARR